MLITFLNSSFFQDKNMVHGRDWEICISISNKITFIFSFIQFLWYIAIYTTYKEFFVKVEKWKLKFWSMHIIPFGDYCNFNLSNTPLNCLQAKPSHLHISHLTATSSTTEIPPHTIIYNRPTTFFTNRPTTSRPRTFSTPKTASQVHHRNNRWLLRFIFSV